MMIKLFRSSIRFQIVSQKTPQKQTKKEKSQF